MELKGLGVSKGKVTGIVKLIKAVADLEDFDENHILVAENTTPSMILAINKAKAIITEKGGMNSHPAILSRELGIPAIVGVKAVLSILNDDEEVEVDGAEGIIIRRSERIHE